MISFIYCEHTSSILRVHKPINACRPVYDLTTLLVAHMKPCTVYHSIGCEGKR